MREETIRVTEMGGEENEWRDMNSAPYNKTTVALIALRSDGSWKTGVGRYMPITGWMGFDESPTHWFPLPRFYPEKKKDAATPTAS